MTLHVRQSPQGNEIKTLVNSVFTTREARSVYRDNFKRGLDILLVLTAAFPVLIVVGLCALLVSRDGGNPFYKQTRVGRFGKTFTMWKLRSMVNNADAALQRHLAADPVARNEWDRNRSFRMIRGSPGSAISCARHLWTSCRSFGMCSRAICRLSAHAP